MIDKYEYKLKFEQMKVLTDEGDYEEAAEIADTIQWRKVRNINLLIKAGDIYSRLKRYEDAKEILQMAYDRSPIGRMIIYRLAEIAIKMKSFEEAKDYYEEFVEIAPHDNLKYVLRYKISKAKGADLQTRIAILEELKEAEYTEEWAFELAYLYHKAGEYEKCIDACDELILWFGDGIYVERALELKMLHKPLTKTQEDKYRACKLRRDGVKEVYPQEEVVQIPEVKEHVGKFDTAKLQEEIKKNLGQILNAGEKVTVEKSMDPIDKMVQKVPYLQEQAEEQPQDGWERTNQAVETALQSGRQEELADTKAQSIQKTEDIMDLIADVIPRIDGVASQAQLMREEYLPGDNQLPKRRGRMHTDVRLRGQPFGQPKEDVSQEPDLLRKIKRAKPKFRGQLGERAYIPRRIRQDDAGHKVLSATAVDDGPGGHESPPGTGANGDPGGNAAWPEGYDGYEAGTAWPGENDGYEEQPATDIGNGSGSRPEAPEGDDLQAQISQPGNHSGYGQQLEMETASFQEGYEGQPEMNGQDMLYGGFGNQTGMDGAYGNMHELEPTESYGEQTDGGMSEAYGIQGGMEQPEAYGIQGGMEQPEAYGIQGGMEQPEAYGIQGGVGQPETDRTCPSEESAEAYKLQPGIEPSETDKIALGIGEAEIHGMQSGTEPSDFYGNNPDLESADANSMQPEMETIASYGAWPPDAAQSGSIGNEPGEKQPQPYIIRSTESKPDDGGKYADQIPNTQSIHAERPDIIDSEGYEECEAETISPAAAEMDSTQMFGGEDDPIASEEMRMAEAEFYGIPTETLADGEPESLVAEMLARQDTKEIKSRQIEQALAMQMQEMPEEIEQTETDMSGEDTEPFPELTELDDELKAVFSYFVPVAGMEKQICEALTGALAKFAGKGVLSGGNILIQGGRGCGKTILATRLVKALKRISQRKDITLGKIDAEKLNQKDLTKLLEQVQGGCLVVEQAGDMTRETAIKLSLLLENDDTGILVILEDTRKGLEEALKKDETFARKFTHRIVIPVFTSDELVEFGKTYAHERDYEIDNMGVLALYNRISNIQKLDTPTTLIEIKDIVDEAIQKAEKKSWKKAFSILTSRRYNEDDYVMLREKDFEES